MTPSAWTAASRMREFENWNTLNICTDFKLSVCKSCKKEKLQSVALLKHLNSHLTLTDGVLMFTTVYLKKKDACVSFLRCYNTIDISALLYMETASTSFI